MRRCKLCLIAAAAAFLTLAGAVVLGWLLPRALAAPGVIFEPCSIKTCAALKGEVSGAVGPVVVQSDTISGITGVPGCPSCARLSSRTSQTGLYVVGSPDDVACKLFGGDTCKSR